MNWHDLLDQLDAWFARGVADAGPGVVLCRRGCSACCHGPFDISPADARMVAAAVASLPEDIRTGATDRARQQLARYHAVAATWQPPWDTEALGDDAFDEVCDALAAMPCPVLDETGGCLVYAHRPATCRMTGLAMQTLDGDVLENVCPIIDTSAEYAALASTLFDLGAFEAAFEVHDAHAMLEGWVPTTIAGAITR